MTRSVNGRPIASAGNPMELPYAGQLPALGLIKRHREQKLNMLQIEDEVSEI